MPAPEIPEKAVSSHADAVGACRTFLRPGISVQQNVNLHSKPLTITAKDIIITVLKLVMSIAGLVMYKF